MMSNCSPTNVEVVLKGSACLKFIKHVQQFSFYTNMVRKQAKVTWQNVSDKIITNSKEKYKQKSQSIDNEKAT